MIASAKPDLSMRSAVVSRSALESNFLALRGQHGDALALDLRANAYGCGLPQISDLARSVGIAFARYQDTEDGESRIAHAPADSVVVSDWWSGENGSAVSLRAHIISLKRVAPDSPVSYGYQYRTSQETTLALVCAGFADGVPRTASGSAHVAIRGKVLPIAGRIAMDQFIVDCGDSEVELGDEVEIWGALPSLSQWSSWSGRTEGELLSHIGSRVVRVWS
jgi:alanine racemase